MTTQVRLRGRSTMTAVQFTNHAVERFQERVRPTLGTGGAIAELARIVPFCELRLGSPPWCGRESAFLYLVIGDVCFP